MVIIPVAPKPPPQIIPALTELGQHFFQRSPAAVTHWQQQGLSQSKQLLRLTEQFYLSLENQPQVSKAQKQVLSIICKRREKDLQRFAEPWGSDSLEVGFSPTACHSLEQLILEYRWHQRAFQCMAWLLELQAEKKPAEVFQSCADNLFFDLGFLQLAYARSNSRGE